MVIKVLTKLRKRMGEHNGNFNKEQENIKYKTSHTVKKTIAPLKNSLGRINSRLDEVDIQVSELEEKAVIPRIKS